MTDTPNAAVTATSSKGELPAVECPRCHAHFMTPELAARLNCKGILDGSTDDLQAALEQERVQHRAWCEVFGTTQLTHAKARLESAESALAQERAARKAAEIQIGELNLSLVNCGESTHQLSTQFLDEHERAEQAEQRLTQMEAKVQEVGFITDSRDRHYRVTWTTSPMNLIAGDTLYVRSPRTAAAHTVYREGVGFIRDETRGKVVMSPLEQFGIAVLKESRDELADLDGGWIQDKAEEFGLLVRHHVIEPCGEQCRCEDFPGDCLRYSEEAEAAIRPVVPIDRAPQGGKGE